MFFSSSSPPLAILILYSDKSSRGGQHHISQHIRVPRGVAAGELSVDVVAHTQQHGACRREVQSAQEYSGSGSPPAQERGLCRWPGWLRRVGLRPTGISSQITQIRQSTIDHRHVIGRFSANPLHGVQFCEICGICVEIPPRNAAMSNPTLANRRNRLNKSAQSAIQATGTRSSVLY